jgi:thymidine phosphorylase
VSHQGGNPEALRNTSKLPKARSRREIPSHAAGYVESINCEQVGIASLVLGGGREKKEDSIDPAVGIVLHKKVGDAIGANEPVCTLHYNSDARMREAEELIYSSYKIGQTRTRGRTQLIRKVIEGNKTTT